MAQDTLRHTDVEIRGFDDAGWVSFEEWCTHASKFSSVYLFLADKRTDFGKLCIYVDPDKTLIVESETGISTRLRFTALAWRMKNVCVKD